MFKRPSIQTYAGSSILFKFLNRAACRYTLFIEKIALFYSASFTRRLSNGFIRLRASAVQYFRITLKHSLFYRLTEIRAAFSSDILKTSRASKAVCNFIIRFKASRFKACAKESFFAPYFQGLKFNLSLKAAGVILITMITTNAILSVIMNKPLALWQVPAHILLLFIGIISLFSNMSWQALKQSSVILRRIK